MLSLISLVSCAQFEDRGEILKAYIQKRDCSGAENYARNMVAEDSERFFSLGIVYVGCYRKKEQGVEYLKYAAQKGNRHAVDVLIRLGEKPPEPPKVIYQERIVQQPQQIIIQQQPEINNNACIQDGGGIYCPNHPNTRRR